MIGILIGIGGGITKFLPRFFQDEIPTSPVKREQQIQKEENFAKEAPRKQKESSLTIAREEQEKPTELTVGITAGEWQTRKQEEKLQGAGKDATTPLPSRLLQGHLQVNVNVETATVKVNGVTVGVAHKSEPLLMHDLTTGTVQIQVDAEGYEPLERLVEIVTNKWTQESFALKQLPALEQKALVKPDVEQSLSKSFPSIPPPTMPPSSSGAVTYWELDSAGKPVARSSEELSKQKRDKKPAR